MSRSDSERTLRESVSARAPHNLPAPMTAFVGREVECAQARALLRDPTCRLVSITGVGGVGKTRMALEIARAFSSEPRSPFPDGIYMVPLAALSASGPLDDVLAAAIVSALGVTFSGTEMLAVRIRQYLRAKTMLLLLDNMEHLTTGVVFLIGLLQDAPGLKLLVTSHERLRLHGEWIVALEGLPFPDQRAMPSDISAGASGPEEEAASLWSESDLERYSAMRLFAQATRMYTPDFALTPATAQAVAQICRLVAGLPLGIELAASWTRLLSCKDIAAEIAQSLDFLADAAPDLPPRQQSMRAVLDHSWNLLTAPEQQTLRQLAVLRGSFTREAATAVIELSIEDEALKTITAGESPRNAQFSILNLLASLVDKSLLRRTVVGASARYELLELLRQYAAGQLERTGEAEAAAMRHAAYYCDLLAARTADLRGAGQLAALAAIGAEIAQIRAAWQWAITAGDIESIGRAAEGLFHFYDMRSWFREGALAFAAARQALERRPDDPAATLVLGKVLAREGWFMFHEGHQIEAQALLERSLTLLRALDARAELIFPLNYLGVVCSYLGEYLRSQTLCREGLAIAQALGDQYGQAVACNILGQVAYDQGDYTAAQAWSQQSLAIEQRIGTQWSMTFSLTNLGKVAYATGAYAQARWFFEESLRTRQAMDDTRGVALCLNRLGDAAAALGARDEAWDHYEESLELFHAIGNQWGMAASLIHLGHLALAQEHDTPALSLLQEALRLALGTQSLPQVVAILAAAAPLVRRGGAPAWADELDQLAADAPASLDAYRAHAERLLVWSRSADAPAEAINLGQAPGAPHEPAPVGGTQRRAPSARPAPHAAAAYPAGLTAREVEVLRLVADGLTDAQVAERLVLSRRTVQTHLSSIYSKLQVNTRSAATRFAVEQGLV
ncbi:MAG: LuxR C-terminal-related transcriptional regulator [Roseiflexaceae bacterium]